MHVLTAREELADRVAGLELGADDSLPKPFEPREFVARIQALLRRVGKERAPEPCAERVQADDLLVALRGRRAWLRNVLENALKFSPATGPPVEVWVQRDETSVFVSVRDYGPGIPPEEQARIFEPFYRIDKS